MIIVRHSIFNFGMHFLMIVLCTPILRILIIILFATRNTSLSHRGYMNCMLHFTIFQKPFGAPSFPTTHPLDLDLSSMFSHTSTFYDMVEHPLTQVNSLPTLSYLFSYWDISEASLVINVNKVVDEEGFQAKFFKHGLHL
jgi:hypothetical protein